MKKLVSLLLLCACAVVLWATVASPKTFPVKQVDGTTLLVRICGDENFNYLTTADGYTIAKRANAYEYVDFDENDSVHYTHVVAHNAEQRTDYELEFLSARVKGLPQTTIERQSRVRRRSMPTHQPEKRSFPLKDSPRSLVILVEFTDVKFVTANAKQAFSNMLNQSGYADNGATGSVRDYFIASSDSAFSPEFDVYGPYTLSQNQAYYGKNTSTSNSVNARQMVIEACNNAYNAGVDFAQYDTDNDGYLDNVFIYFAGHNEAEGGGENTVWPHRSVILASPEYNGIKLYDYACTSELKNSSGKTMCSIGTFCHEFSHVLGLPDFYDTENGYYTIGSWDIMSSGNYNNDGRTPPAYNAFERFSLGWLKPEQLEDAGTYVLEPLETSNSAYLVAAKHHNLSSLNPTPNEFFLVENRQHVGWDKPQSALPGVGMLVFHINYDMSAWNMNTVNNTHSNLRFDIVEAYSTNPTSSSSSDTYPGSKDITMCQLTLHDGTDLEMPLFNIVQQATDVSFIFKSDSANSFLFEPANLQQFTSTYDKWNYSSKVVEWECQTLNVSGQHLSPSDKVNISTKNGFQISFDSLTWKTALTDTICADSTYHRKLFVRYYPTAQNCTAISGTLTVQSATSINLMSLTGISPRPTYVTTPHLKTPTDVTPYSFFVEWDAVSDAERYYFEVYNITDGNTEFVQSFEQFNDKSKMLEEGWQSNFNTTTTSAKKMDTRSMLFSKTGDTLVSPKYPLPVTSLNFWLCGTYVNDLYSATTGGVVTLYAHDGECWTIIDSIVCDKSTKRTYDYHFDYAQSYTQFCFRYVHEGGNGGLALDAYTAVCEKNVNYIYRNGELMVTADAERRVYIGGLNPNSEYFVKIQCTDYGKGCEEHITAWSEPLSITTMSGEAVDSKQLTITVEQGHYVVYVPNADVNSQIYIYSTDGVLQAIVPIGDNQTNRVELPDLRQNGVYVVKYVSNNRLKRKGQQWAKFLYQKF